MVTAARYTFDAIDIESGARRVTRGGKRLALPARHVAVLLQLAAHAGEVQSKDALIAAGWGDVAVTDNSVEQAISSLRRALGSRPDGAAYIETVPRQGYRLAAAVTRAAPPASDETIDRLLSPHRAWLEGRTALETLGVEQACAAQAAFERALAADADSAAAHIGLANALAFRFESTRADAAPDLAALQRAVRHARAACRLDPDWPEAWATLGFTLTHVDAVESAAAARRAATLEPDNWRHAVRLAVASWGEERLRAAHRAIALLPGLALAHWLAATVHVARQAFGLAERELRAGITSDAGTPADARFSAVGLHWLLGLVLLAGGDDRAAAGTLRRELAAESRGHLYSRECCANVWYALGAIALHRDERDQARDAFAEALRRVDAHPGARAALRMLDAPESGCAITAADVLPQYREGRSAWLLPVEPLLRPYADPVRWAADLARVRAGAA